MTLNGKWREEKADAVRRPGEHDHDYLIHATPNTATPSATQVEGTKRKVVKHAR